MTPTTQTYEYEDKIQINQTIHVKNRFIAFLDRVFKIIDNYNIDQDKWGTTLLKLAKQ